MSGGWQADLAHWRAARLAALVAEDGWLNLTDRIDTGPGTHRVGSGAGADLRLSAGPADLGLLEIDADGQARFTTPGGVTAPFVPMPDAFPRLRVPPFLLELHTVAGIPALRVRLIDHPARREFAGLGHFPDDPAWVITARWEALAMPVTTTVGMVSGATDTVRQTHVARFDHDGHAVALVPTHVKGGKPMFVIRDATSGAGTYGAARFLLGEVRGDTVTLDFNRAHNPPCAFTDLAVCPLPPRDNILPFAVRAGELSP